MHWEKKEHTRVVKMDKKRLKFALAVLNAVKSRFPDTKDFVDETLKEECEKENDCRRSNFFASLEAKN